MSIESQIQARGLTAARVTPDDIEANIASEHYFTAYEGYLGAAPKPGRYDPEVDPASLDTLKLLSFCVLVLRNGFTVTGESACVSPENYDREIGLAIARKNAVEKIWPLMGYALKEQVAQ